MTLAFMHYILSHASFCYADFSYCFYDRNAYLKAETYIKQKAKQYTAGTMRGGGFWCVGDFKERSIFIKFEEE